MTRTDQSQEAQIMSKMDELVGSLCVVTFKQEGDRRGIIERVESCIILNDFQESFERSQFKIHLTSGDIVVVPGSAISEIEYGPADGSKPPKKKTSGMKVRKAKTKTKKISTAKRRSIATRGSRTKPPKTTKKRRPKKL
jgi:hypothetical protein